MDIDMTADATTAWQTRVVAAGPSHWTPESDYWSQRYKKVPGRDGQMKPSRGPSRRALRHSKEISLWPYRNGVFYSSLP